jgi:hypothetical protein
MKKFLLVLICFISLTGSAQSLFISLPVEFVSNTNDGGTRPKIALYHDSIPLVVHSKGGADPAVYFSRWNGIGFDAPLRLSSPGALTLSSFINGPEIAVSGDTVYIVYADHTNEGSIVLFRSFDGGLNFDDSIIVASYPANHVEFPGVVILPGGNPFVSFMLADLTVSATELVTCYSTDGGSTFSAPQNVSNQNPGQPCECCPNSLISDGNRVVLGYRNNDSNIREFYSLISTDGGQSFTGQRIDTSNWFNAGCPSNGIDLQVDNDSLFWAFCTLHTNFMRVQSGGLQLTNPSTPGNIRADTSSVNTAQSHASIAGNHDTMIVAWQDNRVGSADIYVAFHTTAGEPFAGPFRVNNTTMGTQRTADLAFANGMFHVVYQDQTGGKAYYHRMAFSEFTGIQILNELKNEAFLYPNPAKETIIVSIANGSTVISGYEIYDFSGRKVIENPVVLSTGVQINISSLPAGIYFIQLLLEDGSSSITKFTKD